ncbi:MAG: tetratricopeptide repeat protein, partial [Candidatus Sericytochromatia bacterium]|nr:tetratricopeptide repeat protein [Candidatus Sericytochromatia bacterium]
MSNKSLVLTILEAPSGYGKTYYLNNLLPNIYNEKTIRIDIHDFIHRPELLFEELKNICLKSNLPYCNSLTAYDWYQVWKESDSFTFIIENYHLVSNLINDFISFFIYKSLDNIQFIISSRQKIDLPFENIFVQDKAQYLDLSSLKLSLNQTKKIWSDNKLEWSDKDEEFYNYYDGWNKGIFLYLQKQKNMIKQKLFNQLIESSIKDVTEQYINKQVNKTINEIDTLPDIFQNKIKLSYQNKVEYWLYLAQNKKLNPENVQIFLERALNISYSNDDLENIINISSKLGRSYSLSSDFSKVDLVLSNSEQFVNLTKSESRISWYYLKANRLRQLCQHDQAIELAKKILLIKSNTNISLHLQTKAMVLIGLTEYQQGNYEETRKYYNKVLLLSDSENNFSLNLEINIMLAFLDRWEGKENIILPDNILELINNQSLKAQPIMLLNLAFYGLLGEKVDLELAVKILSKIK